MNLVLTRTTFSPYDTLGTLSVDAAHECVTLELPVKDGLPGSAIPEGTYPVVLAPSPKFQALAASATAPEDRAWWGKYAWQMPHIIHIVNRTLIMLHPGNTVAETDGCVLVGQQAEVGYVTNSRLAFAALFVKIQAGILSGGCSITVTQ